MSARARFHISRVCLVVVYVTYATTWASGTTCPSAKYNGNQWAKGTKVYYNVSTLDKTQQAEVAQAISDWNSANTTDGSNVSFAPSTSSNPATLVFSNTPIVPPKGTAKCTVPAGDAAFTCPILTLGTQNIVGAAVVFNLDNKIPGTDPPQPIWNPNGPNYDTFVLQVALHEIGHTMGLGEQSDSCSAINPDTVMNGYCGTNDDAKGGNIASSLGTCDTSQVKNNKAYGGTASGSGGGNAAGGGSNGNCSGDAPNDSCVCSSSVWDCECSGLPPTCSDGTYAVCFNSSWTCGTVSVCTGTAPTCSTGTEAECIDDTWQCADECS